MKTCSAIRLPLSLAAFLAASSRFAQQPITAITTSNSTLTPVSYTGVKGAGLYTSGGIMGSDWDSTGTNFTVNFNSGTNNRTSITQFTVTGHANPLAPLSTNAVVKVRRLANAYV